MLSPLLLLLLWPADRPVDRIPLPEIPGWTRTADSSHYEATNLWDLIDGAAETYILYGFRQLTVGEYAGAEGCTVRVEIYAHASPTMAFGIYATERQPEYQWVDVGTEGYQEEEVLNFLAGSYYCKLTSHEREGRNRLLEIARAVDAALGGSREWPDGLRHLPPGGRSPYSEGYVPSEVLGYSFLTDAFTASYGGGTRLYAIRGETPAAARKMGERYASLTGARERPGAGWELTDPNNGPVTLLLRGRILYAIVNAPPPEAQRLTRAIGLLAD